MKNKVFIVGILLINSMSCSNKSTNDLEAKIVNYKALPKPVKETFFYDRGHLREKNKPQKYLYESESEFLMPWIYKSYVKNLVSNQRYRIDPNKEYGYPYVIYGDSLYIPNNKYIGFIEKDSLSYTFTKFILK